MSNTLGVHGRMISFTNKAGSQRTNRFVIKDIGGYNIVNVRMFLSDITNLNSGMILPKNYLSLNMGMWPLLVPGRQSQIP